MFFANRKLIKQIDGCPMGGPISVVFLSYTCAKWNLMLLSPTKPLFYKCYIGDTYRYIYIPRKKNIRDTFLEDLNSYHQNIKLTMEVNSSTFFDTELIREKGSILMQVFNKSHKFPMNWGSKISIRYKHNAIIGELHRAQQIMPNFDKEMWRIREKY